MIKANVVAQSIHELRPKNVPFRHSFELTDESPIFHQPSKMAPQHNVIVQKGIDVMLEAGIITPASSAWLVPVLIAPKREMESQDFLWIIVFLTVAWKQTFFLIQKSRRYLTSQPLGFSSRRWTFSQAIGKSG